LNSGPGCVGGAFIHERHHKAETPRLGGWWGHDKQTRFKMEKGFLHKGMALNRLVNFLMVNQKVWGFAIM